MVKADLQKSWITLLKKVLIAEILLLLPKLRTYVKKLEPSENPTEGNSRGFSGEGQNLDVTKR